MRSISKYFKDSSIRSVDGLTPPALMVLGDIICWCIEKGVTPVITDTVSTLEDDLALNRVSSTHRDGRAFDISTRGWDRELVAECVRVFNMKYRHIAALDSIGNTKLVYFHNAGFGEHLHFQVHKRFTVDG